MGLLYTLIKNSLRLDFKMLVPFFGTIVLVVFVITTTYLSCNLFIDESRDPSIQKLGGHISVYKSSQPAKFTYSENGWSENWYKELFEPQDFKGFENDKSLTLNLTFWGKHNFSFQMNTLLIGREENTLSPKWEIKKGEQTVVSNIEDWNAKGRPVVVLISDTLPLKIRNNVKVGNQFEAFIPNIIDSGGVLNIKGADKTIMLPEDATNIDYLDYDNGKWITLTVAAIGRDGLGGIDDSAIVFPLDILQELANANNKINSIGISLPNNTEEEISTIANDITKINPGIYGLKTTDIFYNIVNNGYDIENHVSLLINSIYLLCSIMVVCVLTLIIRNRKFLDVQLIALGVKNSTLAIVIITEILIVTTAAILVGLGVPAFLSLLKSGKIVVDGLQILKLIAIIPFNLIVTIIVSKIMLPSSKQCLEVLRNE